MLEFCDKLAITSCSSIDDHLALPCLRNTSFSWLRLSFSPPLILIIFFSVFQNVYAVPSTFCFGTLFIISRKKNILFIH